MCVYIFLCFRKREIEEKTRIGLRSCDFNGACHRPIPEKGLKIDRKLMKHELLLFYEVVFLCLLYGNKNVSFADNFKSRLENKIFVFLFVEVKMFCSLVI